MSKTFSIISLGCFRNTYDSEVIVSKFNLEGYKFIETFDNLDLLIVNTCGFIKTAKEESLDFIQEVIDLKLKNKVKKIIVMGCLVQRYKDELSKNFPEVDEWRGVEEFKRTFTKRKKILPAHLDFLKICEGCLNKCSYCSIPAIKGPLVSKSDDEILKEVKFLDSSRVKEVNIIGQDITSWGRDLGKDKDLLFLVKKILRQSKNINWFRLIYTHPRHFTDDLIGLIAKNKRICKYVDLPIQHINDRILNLMNRGTKKKDIITLVKKIRKIIPGVVIRTSLIVGFPGETDDEFDELLDFVAKMKFERLGVFKYSKEDDTQAFFLKPQILERVKKLRFDKIMKLQKNISCEYNKKYLGKTVNVLVDSKDQDIYIGRLEHSAYEVDGVVYIKRKKMKIGEFYKVRVVDTLEYDLVAE